MITKGIRRILRPRPQRPHAGRFAGSGMDADAIRHDRRSEGRRGIVERMNRILFAMRF